MAVRKISPVVSQREFEVPTEAVFNADPRWQGDTCKPVTGEVK